MKLIFLFLSMIMIAVAPTPSPTPTPTPVSTPTQFSSQVKSFVVMCVSGGFNGGIYDYKLVANQTTIDIQTNNPVCSVGSVETVTISP